jgi:hypothetical protein
LSFRSNEELGRRRENPDTNHSNEYSSTGLIAAEKRREEKRRGKERRGDETKDDKARGKEIAPAS